jgi:rod shape-determining protein MreC
MSGYFQDRQTAQFNEQQARSEMMALAARASQTKELMLENSQLRALLETRARLGFSTRSAEAIYEAKDSFSRKLILDAGQAAGVIGGAAVMDESGLVGQITRTYPLLSELTLITDPEQATSVLNTRTGARGLVFGESSAAGQLELRFMAANADVELGDILTTSGIDGVFPPGLPVAKISQIDRQSDSVFARIRCQPIARLDGVRHLLVILSEGSQLPAKPEPNDTQRKTARTSKQ